MNPATCIDSPPPSLCSRVLIWTAGAVLVLLALGRSAGAAGVDPLPFAPALSGDSSGQMATTAGLSLRGADGRSWAYLTWSSDAPEFLRRAVVAVYRKEGGQDAPGNYSLVSLVSRSEEIPVIHAALQKAQSIGQDLALLDTVIQGAFAELAPAPSMSLEQKLQLILHSAGTRIEVAHTLQFLARSQPSIAAAAGQAFIADVPTGVPTTFELRVCDHIPRDAAVECTAVMARITVIGGGATILPAPGRPADVSWKSPRGDLNVRLIWSSPDALRAESLLQAGFNVYRVTLDYYARAFATRAPGPGDLARASASAPAAVKRVNRQAIYPDSQLNDREVEDIVRGLSLANEEQAPFFVIDDNDRFDAGGKKFTDGEQFWYYVVARDLLGREGIPSAPTLITLCGRRAPVPPASLRVEVINKSPAPSQPTDQFFQIRWGRNPTNSAAVPTDGYYVYRWNAPDEPTRPPRPDTPPVQPVKIVPAGARDALFYTAIDDNDQRPRLPDADQKTYWYTVRAYRQSPCRDVLLSGHSAPVPGVLRQFDGPGRGSGELLVFCAKPRVQFIAATEQTVAIRNPRVQELDLICDREAPDQSTAWVDYYLAAQDTPDETGANLSRDRFLGRAWFSVGASSTALQARIPRSGAKRVRIRCRAGNYQGEVSDVTDALLISQGTWSKFQVRFKSLYVPGAQVPLAECDHHSTRRPDTGRTQPIGFVLSYPPHGREHRLYASIDGGPLNLIARGTNVPSAGVTEQFSGFPANSANICFYYQNLDSQGQKGPLILLGCVQASGLQAPPTPQLSKPKAIVGPHGGTTFAQLDWFCPPQTVQRFRVYVSTANPSSLPASLSSSLYASDADRIDLIEGRSYRVYETGRVGANFGSATDPRFSLVADVSPGVAYTFRVQAVDSIGAVSRVSDAFDFQWSTKAPLPDAPIAWPARALPVVSASLPTPPPPGGRALPSLADAATAPVSFLTPECWSDPSGLHVGLLIGEIALPRSAFAIDLNTGAPSINGPVDPMDLVGTLFSEDPVHPRSTLPCVVYRYQESSTSFPDASGDVVQVSPLMQAIAYRITAPPNPVKTLFLDPFVDLRVVDVGGASVLRLYLRDTQPVVQEASYRYVVVRFTRAGEIEAVAHTPSLKIP